MVRTVPFRADHLATLKPQAAQRAEFEAITPESARAHEMAGSGYTILVDDHAVACAVLAELGDGRGAIWALIGADAGPYMRRAWGVATRMMLESGLRRIETIVATDFEAGHRWVKMLGFELETPNGMRSFGPNGETCSLYARILK